MKKFVTSVALFLVTSLVLTPTTDGQNRGRANMGGHKPTSTTVQSRPGNMGRPSGNQGNVSRPSTSRPSGNDQGYRPGGNGNNNRPGNNNNHRPGGNDRPGGNHHPGGNNHRPDNRPGGYPGNNYRPGGYDRPGGNHHPGNHRPGGPSPAHRPGHVPPPPHSVPYRPYMPANRPWMRPTPPPSFRPYGRLPRFGSIFNISFGTTFNISLNAMINSGYTVTGYGSNVIYLSNINQYGYIWPNATMHYNNGVLSGTQFVYSSPGYDMSRYNILYNNFVGQYGYPVSVQNNGANNISVTWWGYNNSYITLSFYPDYAYNGTYRYYTTLQIGN